MLFRTAGVSPAHGAQASGMPLHVRLVHSLRSLARQCQIRCVRVEDAASSSSSDPQMTFSFELMSGRDARGPQESEP
jgi:hypothetical protein